MLQCIMQKLEEIGQGSAIVTIDGSSVTVVFKTKPETATSTGDAIVSRVCECGAGTYSVTGEDEGTTTGEGPVGPPLYSNQGSCG